MIRGNDITNIFNKDKSRGSEIGIEQLQIDEETFMNSIFVSQNNVLVDSVGRKSVMQKLTNMIQSGDESISIDKAKQKLQRKLLDEVGSERTQNKPLNAVTREISLLEEKKTNLILNREKQTTINDREKELDKKLLATEDELEKVTKVLEIKNRYSQLLKERENDYEIAVKIAEKEYQKKLEIKKKTKKHAIVLSASISIILALVFLILKWYAVSGVIATIGVILTVVLFKVLSMDVKMGVVPNFDAIREDFKKKEN